MIKNRTLPFHYVKVKRDKSGVCNICEKPSKLTWDHVPPQSGIDITPLDQYTILERLTGRELNPQSVQTQNGVKYRTLCANCNNALLGHEYDPVLNEFALGIGRFLHTTIKLPATVNYPTKPARLLRAIFGHMLAAKVEVEQTKSDQAMRKFFLDATACLPRDLNVFMWLYPYPNVVSISDVSMLARRGRFDQFGVFSILKYFPIAYLVTNLRQHENLSCLSFHWTSDRDAVVQVPISLYSYMPSDWPEIVDEGNMLAGAGCSRNSALFAVPRGTEIRGPVSTNKHITGTK